MKKRLGILMGLALLFTVSGTGVASASAGDITIGVPSQTDLPFTNKIVANQQASHQQSGVTFSYSDINININTAYGTTTFLTIDPPTPMY